MNDLFVGNNITGNFKPLEEYKNIKDYKIEKLEGELYLRNNKETIKLSPLDKEAEMVIYNFSTEIGEFNESIYKIEENKGILIVILYVYKEVQKLLLESQKISIHLLRDVEKQICTEGYGKFKKLNSSNEIVPYLADLFINNNSIFVNINDKYKNSFQMFGKNCCANVKMERPGVYVIDKLYRHYNKEYYFSLTQIYGNIEFVLWEDSVAIKGNSNLSLQNVKTNDVFKAWQEYMEFENKIYEDNLTDLGFIKYINMDIAEDQLRFNLEEEISEEKINNNSFEFITSYSQEGTKKLPQTIEGLLELKRADRKASIYLGKCKNEGAYENKLVFDIPNIGFEREMENSKGILYVSDHNIQIEQRRRKKVLKEIEAKKNKSSNIIMNLSSSEVVDFQLGTEYKPVNDRVLKKMFGNKNVVLKQTYYEAMFTALNTPDIALIQGPPGTGKTTLIKGIITRLNDMGQNYKILVSSEQHEALYNVVDKLSQNKFIPPFISSKKFDMDSDDDDNEHFERNVREFQQNFMLLCNDILKEKENKSNRTAKLTTIGYILQNIRDNNYSVNYILKVIEELRINIIELGYYNELKAELTKLYQVIRVPSKFDDVEELDFETREIIRKIKSQRTDKSVFIEDDGVWQLKELQRLLLKKEYNEFMLDKEVFDLLTSEDENKIDKNFDKYIDYVNNIKEEFVPRENNEFEKSKEPPKSIIEDLSSKISKLSKSAPRDFYEIVESLTYRLNDIDVAADIIKNYTSVIGSTCAQAEKSIEIVELSKYDYVIIDEAARANPLDIMIPMMLGTKIILIGDHKQLPHYIESNYVNKFKQEKERYSKYNENLLTKSLFQIIYENLDKAYKEDRIKFKRTIQIDEQHRMHPTIGNFISKEFYGGTIANGEKTIENINNYNMFDKKNVVWINVPIFEGGENKINQSIERKAEVNRIISILKDLVNKNEEKRLDIGIISFYKGQVELLNTKLKEEFPQNILDCISCNTVDSYQGKEFDIVILSGVRSNNLGTAEKSLGFIHYSASRINVALSRAKKLLIMVADADTYRKTEHFRNFIEYVKKEGYYGE